MDEKVNERVDALDFASYIILLQTGGEKSSLLSSNQLETLILLILIDKMSVFTRFSTTLSNVKARYINHVNDHFKKDQCALRRKEK